MKYNNIGAAALMALTISSAQVFAGNVLAELKVSEAGIYSLTVRDLRKQGILVAGRKLRDLNITYQSKSISRAGFRGNQRVSENTNLQSSDRIEFVVSTENIESSQSFYENNAIYRLEELKPSDSPSIIRLDNRQLKNGTANFSDYFIDKVVVERDAKFESDSHSDDPWIAKSLIAFKGLSSTYKENVNLKSVYTKNNLVGWNIKAYVTGGSDSDLVKNDHRVKFMVNGVTKSLAKFSAYESREIIARGKVKELKNDNELKLIVPGTNSSGLIDVVEVDKFEVHYPRKYIADNGGLVFSSSDSQFRLKALDDKIRIYYELPNGKTYQVINTKKHKVGSKYIHDFKGGRVRNNRGKLNYYVSNIDKLKKAKIVKPENINIDKVLNTDYLVISATKYLKSHSLKKLMNQRKLEGLSVSIVGVNSIYNHYSHGHKSADSIAEFIQDAYKKGTKYVLLVGNTHVDLLNNVSNAPNQIPSLYKETEHEKWVLSDAAYADVNDDNLPDLALGRLPVSNNAELDNMIEKTLKYQGLTNGVSLVADKEFEVSFKSELTSIVNSTSLREEADVSEVFFDDIGDAKKMSDEIASSIADSGVVLYYGHGQINGLGRTERLFQLDDSENIASSETSSIFYGLACALSDYANHHHKGVIKSMLVDENGSAASIGGITLVSNLRIKQYTTDILNHTKANTRLGDVLVNSKRDFAQKYSNKIPKDILNGIVLLGDPAMKL